MKPQKQTGPLEKYQHSYGIVFELLNTLIWMLFVYFCICPTVHEGSGETSQKETSTCDICQFGAECDEDAEDVW